MKTVKKSIILCLCAALLLTPLLTACDLFNDIETQEAVTEPALQDCGHEPYRIEAKDGQAEIIFDPCYTKPFVLEIPEIGEDGNPITQIRVNPEAAMLPSIISEEDFSVFRGKLEEYYGVSYEDAKIIKDDSSNPLYRNSFDLVKYLCYFFRLSLDDCPNDSQRESLLQAYPILEKMNIYIMDGNISTWEFLRIYQVVRQAAPELDDVWYDETLVRTMYSDPDFSGMCETLTEIRFPSQLEEIYPLTFVGSQLTTVTIPGSVKTVYCGAFAVNEALEEITFEEGVIHIEEDVLFGSDHVKTINLPASLESLGRRLNTNFYRDGYECEIPTINYAGTMAQWEALFWNEQYDKANYDGYEYFDIHCADGVVQATRTFD